MNTNNQQPLATTELKAHKQNCGGGKFSLMPQKILACDCGAYSSEEKAQLKERFATNEIATTGTCPVLFTPEEIQDACCVLDGAMIECEKHMLDSIGEREHWNHWLKQHEVASRLYSKFDQLRKETK